MGTELRAPKRRLSDTKFALIIVLGVTAFNVAIVGYPLALSFWTSLRNVNPVRRIDEFVGIQNYIDAWGTPRFLQSLGTTMIFVADATILSVVLGLAYALVMNETFFGRGAFRSIVLLPWAISEAVTGITWGLMYNSEVGHLNGFFKAIGLVQSNVYWLNENWAIHMSAVSFAWHWAPLGAFFLLAALQTIPDYLYKAAKIDGAGPIRRFWTVTIPGVKYAIIIVLVIITAQAFMQFDLIYSMTTGGPGVSTLVYSILLYRYNFAQSEYGFASALSFILIAIVLILSMIYFYFLSLRRARRQ